MAADFAVVAFGVSVCGPRHRAERSKNQDAWIRARGSFGHLIVVSDGLGSRPASAIGSRAACIAVRSAARLWPGVAVAPPSHFVRLVEILWLLAVAPRDPSTCAATCAFALREPDGQIIFGGIGDGLALLRAASGDVQTYGGRRHSDFGNETRALGAAHTIADWWIEIDSAARKRAVALVTDGIADDLDPTRVGAFIDWLIQDIAPLPSVDRRRTLRRELEQWPVPGHLDDKSLAVLTEMGVAEE
jgi:Protein phosphatase 2C